MSSFVHTEYPSSHPGLARVQRLFRWGRFKARSSARGHGLAAVLLGANIVAWVAAAYGVMETQSDGHLLALWMLMWLLAFATLAWMAHLQRRVRRRVKRQLQAWRKRQRQRALDAAHWAKANTDARWMQELQVARDWADSRAN